MGNGPGLLVSVRSLDEAGAAVEGGADITDVKEPLRGPLGRADASVVAGVIRYVAGRCPVSAALGELLDADSGTIPEGLAFVKWGLAGCRGLCSWRHRLAARLATRRPPLPWGGFQNRPTGVIAAYADWEQAGAPPVNDVAEFARLWTGTVFLLDTFRKEPLQANKRPTLLDWLSVAEITRLCRLLQPAGVRVALAGSLEAEQIQALQQAQPDWFAVRGAVCDRGHRQNTIRAERVRDLVRLVHGLPSLISSAD
jgi:(5-formylfuran-3-yl)methyl phosphate synthase